MGTVRSRCRGRSASGAEARLLDRRLCVSGAPPSRPTGEQAGAKRLGFRNAAAGGISHCENTACSGQGNPVCRGSLCADPEGVWGILPQGLRGLKGRSLCLVSEPTRRSETRQRSPSSQSAEGPVRRSGVLPRVGTDSSVRIEAAVPSSPQSRWRGRCPEGAAILLRSSAARLGRFPNRRRGGPDGPLFCRWSLGPTGRSGLEREPGLLRFPERRSGGAWVILPRDSAALPGRSCRLESYLRLVGHDSSRIVLKRAAPAAFLPERRVGSTRGGNPLGPVG